MQRGELPEAPAEFLLWFLQVLQGFPGDSAGKEPACNVVDLGLIPGLGRSLEEGNGNPLQYSRLENSMDYIPWGHKESEATERLSLSPSQANKPTACMNFPTELWSASRVCCFPRGWQSPQREDLLKVCRRWTQSALIGKRLVVQKQKGCWNAR